MPRRRLNEKQAIPKAQDTPEYNMAPRLFLADRMLTKPRDRINISTNLVIRCGLVLPRIILTQYINEAVSSSTMLRVSKAARI